MPKEIERKFLVRGGDWPRTSGKQYRQGYLSISEARAVRVRVTPEAAYLTIKGLLDGASRLEYEYPIPRPEAEEMLEGLCIKPLIEKTRYEVEHAGMTWEIDEFQGENAGLVVAEIELERVDQEFQKPDWAGEEVTDDLRYLNVNLVANPYSRW